MEGENLTSSSSARESSTNMNYFIYIYIYIYIFFFFTRESNVDIVPRKTKCTFFRGGSDLISRAKQTCNLFPVKAQSRAMGNTTDT